MDLLPMPKYEGIGIDSALTVANGFVGSRDMHGYCRSRLASDGTIKKRENDFVYLQDRPGLCRVSSVCARSLIPHLGAEDPC